MRCGVVRIVEGLDDGVDGLDTMASTASTMDDEVQSAVVAHNLHREVLRDVTGTPLPQSDE